MERTLVLVKPDGVQRGLIGEVISRLERPGLRLVGAKFLMVRQELAETHYAIHLGKPFYNGLIRYITSSPVMAMVWEGPNAVAAVRQTMGATRPMEAAPGSLRHDFALEVGRISRMILTQWRTVKKRYLYGFNLPNVWIGKEMLIPGYLSNHR